MGELSTTVNRWTPCLLLLTNCPNNPAHSLIGAAVISCNFS